MTTKKLYTPERPCVLVEGPTWGHAEFYGRWLLAASQAEIFWKAAQQDAEFQKQTERVCVVYIPDFALRATIMIMLLKDYRSSFVIDLNSNDVEEFTMMVLMGFFETSDHHYKMVVPVGLNLTSVKDALLNLAKTEDEEFALHPEYLVSTISFAEARACQERIRAIEEFRSGMPLLGHA
jgi:hypothetical protein